GRAKASTMSAIAAARINSRNQWRMRRRRTDWYGIRRTNISEGNVTTRFFSRWIRCTSTGIAIAPSPTKNAGVRKDIADWGLRIADSPDPHQPLAAREIA